MRAPATLLLLFALLLAACSEQWVVVEILPAFGDQDTVVPDMMDSLLVEVTASLSAEVPRTCTTVRRRFDTANGDLQFPLELVLRPSEDRDWVLINVRLTAYRGGTTEDDAVLRAVHQFSPDFAAWGTERIILRERCHADQGGELPCDFGQYCVVGDGGEARCESSGEVDEYFDAEPEVSGSCDGQSP